MKRNFEETFKALRIVEPDEIFARQSRAVILTSRRADERPLTFWGRIFEHAKVSGALVLASVLLFVVMGSVTYFRGADQSPLASFNESKLIAEADTVDFDLHLREAKYLEETHDQVEEVLNALTAHE